LKLKPVLQKETSNDQDADSTPTDGGKNNGKLQLDATVADADIKFPTDLDLLNDSRVKAENLIDYLCKKLDIKEKPRTYRMEYLNISKIKRKPEKVLRRSLRLQINYLKRDIGILNELLDKVKDGRVPFDKHQYKYFFVIQQVLKQQEGMIKEKINNCEDRIVSIHQPHVRPFVRGKTKAKVEFGTKINASL
jgi:transposase, IS5 family